MRPPRPALLVALGLFVVASASAQGVRGDGRGGVEAVRERVRDGDAALRPAYERLLAEADEAVGTAFASILDKDATAPSGDPQDYYSLAPYWWPDPDTPDGLPYVRRDGERNPEARALDDRALSAVLDAVPTLAWAWYFSGDDRYAAKAGDLLRLWFVDPATRMNPNLTYAQGIRGRSDGRKFGIIETSEMPEVVDALAVLKTGPALSAADWGGVDAWLADYLVWLRTSELGIAESNWLNNHATAYDAQVAAIALYLGQDETAREVLAAFPARRIDRQIEPGGIQPQEAARTKSFGYSASNLLHAFNAAALAPRVGVDLFGYESVEGRSLRRALDYLVPVVEGRDNWAFPQLPNAWDDGERRLAALLRRAALAYDAPAYEAARERLDPDPTARYHLLFPHPAR
ncbi:alginate lyase family protein [Rubrivirga sp. S365]|uniref:Alginate lyase family protein n=1 Tax=Rubrivirga litoralis TaxID=3075598 RepID=A0ABU3BNR9_9BACT|nr:MULTISPECIES: alginate lyase family protein [unclassified Rubrivirga]MDT0630908.1 alginate lyase family protein [Rubrivirga sp. F394]MDT7856551.1 alginate lyase family protein [Rubrivirga sp. S365]